MNIEIANRLVALRKKNGFSQEQLAEKIGVSRQAVSKWERSEASPDTDNLILLARIYNVSLDELLSTDDEIPMPQKEDEEFNSDNAQNDSQEQPKTERPKGGFIHVEDDDSYVDIGAKGIYVEDSDGTRVNIGFKGINVVSPDPEECVNVDWKGVNVGGVNYPHGHWWDHYSEKEKPFLANFPYFYLSIAAYLLLGFLANGWWWGWLIFLTVPLFHGLISAIHHRNANHFPYPVLLLLGFLYGGMFYSLWHPLWALFLTIPIYYWLANAFRRDKDKDY